MKNNKPRTSATSLITAVLIFVTTGISAAGAELTLADCINAALENNPDLQRMSHHAAAARAALDEARSAWWPRLALGGNYTRTDNPPQAFMMKLNQRALDMTDPEFDPNNPGDTGNLRLSASAGWRIYDFGRRRSIAAAAAAGADSAGTQELAARNNLVHEITHVYNAVLQAMAMKRVQEQSILSLEDGLRIANERLAAGATIRADVLNIEVQLAQAQEERIRARNGIQLAIAALNSAIGQDLATAQSIRPPEHLPAPESAPPELDPALVENRPEMHAARKMTQAAKAGYRAAGAQRRPVINVFGSYDHDSDGAIDDMHDSYMAGIAAEWEFFDGGQRRAAREQAREKWLAAKAAEAAMRNRLLLDLRQASLQAQDAYERLLVAAKTIESAEEALRITREQYRQGAADSTALLTAEAALCATRMRHAAAYYDYQVALSNIRRVSGRD